MAPYFLYLLVGGLSKVVQCRYVLIPPLTACSLLVLLHSPISIVSSVLLSVRCSPRGVVDAAAAAAAAGLCDWPTPTGSLSTEMDDLALSSTPSPLRLCIRVGGVDGIRAGVVGSGSTGIVARLTLRWSSAVGAPVDLEGLGCFSCVPSCGSEKNAVGWGGTD